MNTADIARRMAEKGLPPSIWNTMTEGQRDGLIECIHDNILAAINEASHADSARLDWLEKQQLEVLRHGEYCSSIKVFAYFNHDKCALSPLLEGLDPKSGWPIKQPLGPWKLRQAIDAAMNAEGKRP